MNQVWDENPITDRLKQKVAGAARPHRHNTLVIAITCASCATNESDFFVVREFLAEAEILRPFCVERNRAD